VLPVNLYLVNGLFCHCSSDMKIVILESFP
jgi:hypothetical protein